MSKKTKAWMLTAMTLATPLVAGALVAPTAAHAAGGLISIIVNDPANPYWLTEGKVAADEAKARVIEAVVGPIVNQRCLRGSPIPDIHILREEREYRPVPMAEIMLPYLPVIVG